ncbi:hypothetical protein F4677DRAFT_370747 [Hypoxylon crocopeplum]|nr:hypothetical protein F4677DRAFT_370747 [Hypoxylon crocopeplum]
MTSDWAARERARIAGRDSTDQHTRQFSIGEYGIRLLTELMEGSIEVNNTLVDELSDRMVQSGSPLKDSWNDFLLLIFSAAMSTSSDRSHHHLVDLVFALAHRHERPATVDATDNMTGTSEVASLFSSLTGFGWIARDYWNGPGTFLHAYGTPDAAQRASVNLNRFMAHLSCQQRKTPVEPLREWVEDFGLWTITDGLEEPAGIREHAEEATAWLIIAGIDIYNDPTWGRRDGKRRTGIPLRQGRLWSARQAEGSTQEMRWDFWKDRLLEIAGDLSKDESVRNVAREAEQVMREIETSAQV